MRRRLLIRKIVTYAAKNSEPTDTYCRTVKDIVPAKMVIT